MTPPRVSVIIPTYNGRAFLDDCLRSLQAQSWRDAEIVVVDNASTDGTTGVIHAAYPEVRVVSLPTNRGFAGGTNAGAAAARGEWLVFLNNDTVVEPDWLEQLMAVGQADPSLGVCSSKIRLMHDRARLDSVGSYLTRCGFLRHVGLLSLDRGQHDDVTDIFSPKGVAFAIRRVLFQEVGGFDDRYFAYFEESDLFWRIWLRGYSVGWAPRAIVYHKVGGTALGFSHAFVDHHSFKNRIRTILKNAEGRTLRWMLPLHVACCLGLALLSALQPRRWGSGWAIVRAISWNIRHWPDTWRARQIVQRGRRVSDATLFPRILRPVPIREFAQYSWWLLWSREQLRVRVHGAPATARIVASNG